MSSKDLSRLKNKYYGVLLLCALSLLAYSNSFHTTFQFDDYHQLAANQNMRLLSNIPRFFYRTDLTSFEPGYVGGYRPLTFTSFALNYAVSGEAVPSYHAVNFILHLLCALLVWQAVRLVLMRSGSVASGEAGFAAAVLFALHPVQTSAVTYISSRAVLLASFFTLLSFVCFLQYRRHGRDLPSRGRAWGAAAPVFFLLALLSKEFPVALPAVMAVYDVLVEGPGPGRKWLYYAPFIIVLLSFLVVRDAVQGFVVQPIVSHSVGNYLMSEAGALLIYLRLLVLPVNLNVDYNFDPTTSVDLRVVLAVILLSSLMLLLYRMRHKRPAMAFFGFWFFIALAPESSFIPITDIAVEYRLYLPSVGFIAFAVSAVSVALESAAARRWALASVAVLFVTLTFARNRAWADEYTLWSDAARKAPYSARAHANLGHALRTEHKWDEAVAELKKALELGPRRVSAEEVHEDLGICYYEQGRTEEALAEFNRAISINPEYAEAYGNLGTALYDLGRYDEAADALLRCIDANPGYALGHIKLSLVYVKLGRTEEAAREAEQGVFYSPKDYFARFNMAVAYMSGGRYAEALDQARLAVGFSNTPMHEEKARALVAELEARLAGAEGGPEEGVH